MQIEILRATVVNKKRVAGGQIVTTDVEQARALIDLGKAVPVVNAPEPENRESEMAPKISKRRGRPPKDD